jgi:hypothetical protein
MTHCTKARIGLQTDRGTEERRFPYDWRSAESDFSMFCDPFRQNGETCF